MLEETFFENLQIETLLFALFILIRLMTEVQLL